MIEKKVCTVTLRWLFILLAASLLLPLSASADECLYLQKSQLVYSPYFENVEVDDEAFQDFDQINKDIQTLVSSQDILPEYWSGNFRHNISYQKDDANSRVTLITWFYHDDKGHLFIDRSYGVIRDGDFVATTQTFKVDEKCQLKLVNTARETTHISDKRIVEKRYVDGELKINTIDVEVMPEQFDILSARFALGFKEKISTSAYLVPEIPYDRVTISASYAESLLDDRVAEKTLNILAKHLDYDFEKVGKLTVDVYESPASLYKKLVLNGVGLKDAVYEQVTRDMWLTSPLGQAQEKVVFKTPLEQIDKKGNVKPYQLLSNKELDHDNLANYPAIHFSGNSEGRYVYTVSSTVEYRPAAAPEIELAKYLQPSYYINSDSPTVMHYASVINDGVDDTHKKMSNILLFISHFTLQYDMAQRDNGNVRLLTTEEILQKGKGVCQHYANLAVALCRASGIPARLIRGYVLKANNAVDHLWIEAYIDNVWRPYEPQSGMPKNVSLPNTYIPVVVSDFYESPSNIIEFKGALKFLEYQLEITDISH